jgi:hypothetical protein
MVTGFNTEIVHQGTVYHIQTETRRSSGIETAVYVRGAIIHSVKTSHEDLVSSPDYTEEKLKKRLEEQHRDVISRIRAGDIRFPDDSQPNSPAPPRGA